MPFSDFGVAERTQGRGLPYSRRPIVAVGRALLTAALGAAKEFHGNRPQRRGPPSGPGGPREATIEWRRRP